VVGLEPEIYRVRHRVIKKKKKRVIKKKTKKKMDETTSGWASGWKRRSFSSYTSILGDI